MEFSHGALVDLPQQELIARQFKQESLKHSLDSGLSPIGFQRCLAMWNVPNTLSYVLFKAFDRDDSQKLEFEEYAIALGTFIKGVFDEKLRCMCIHHLVY